jgi:hypothetical protein
MKWLFRLFSILYIVGIFLFADSHVVADLAPFNPYSLLHIPLYGILTLLLFFSFVPLKSDVRNSTDSTHSTHSTYSTNLTHSTHSTHSTYSTYLTYFVIVVVISLGVAVADEFHQAYVPGRNASVYDVLLDMVGIVLCLFIMKRVRRLSGVC